MRKNPVYALVFLSLFLLGNTLAAQAAPAEEASFSLGAGKAEITPPPGTPLGGYGKYRRQNTKGTHDPLYARAVSLKKDGQQFLFLSADLVLIDYELRKETIKKIRKKIPIQDEQILIAATHAHTGAGSYGSRFWQRFIMGKFRKSAFERIADSLAQAAIQACETSYPVRAEYAEARIDSLIENRMDEKLNYPAVLKVLRFKDRAQIRAQLVFMAAHPTLFPAKEGLYSADFPGVFNGEAEKNTPGAVSLFLNGAAADLRPKAGDFKTKQEATEAYGRKIAAAIRGLSFQPFSLEGLWNARFEKIKLPRTKVRLGPVRAPSLLGNRVFPRHSYFQAVRLGACVFLGFPGELGSENGFEIEQAARARGLHPFLIGFANDYIAYVVPRRYYSDRKQYESRVSFYGPKMDLWVYSVFERITGALLTEEETNRLNPPGKLAEKEGLPAVYLKGTPYHVGFEEGRLLKNQIHAEIDQIYAYLRSQFPVPGINTLVLNKLLDRAWKKMEPFVSPAELAQMRGIAGGAGLSFKTIKRMHAIPEVYPAWCANGAYWGKATSDTRLIAIRNLDWSRQIGIHEHAAVKAVEIPGQNRYVNIGYAGFSGTLSGLNENGISVGQIGAVSKEETLRGTPMPFLLKRILEQTHSLGDAEALFQRTSLTRGYNYLISDAEEKNAIVIEATARRYAVFHDQDAREKSVSYAIPIENALFRGDPALDPEIRDLQIASKGKPDKPGLEMPGGSAYEIRYKKQGELIRQHYGKITPEIAKQMAKEIAPGSNLQSVIYAFPDVWIANAEGDARAVDTEYKHLNFEEIEKALDEL